MSKKTNEHFRSGGSARPSASARPGGSGRYSRPGRGGHRYQNRTINRYYGGYGGYGGWGWGGWGYDYPLAYPVAYPVPVEVPVEKETNKDENEQTVEGYSSISNEASRDEQYILILIAFIIAIVVFLLVRSK